jgi:hypothetical protein
MGKIIVARDPDMDDRWCLVIRASCGTTVRVAHPGLRRGAMYGAAVIAVLLHLVASVPIGRRSDEAHAHDLVDGRPLTASERARSGQPRSSSLRRGMRDLERIWPDLVLPVQVLRCTPTTPVRCEPAGARLPQPQPRCGGCSVVPTRPHRRSLPQPSPAICRSLAR